MTVFEVTCYTDHSSVTTLFVSREVAVSSIKLSFSKIEEPRRTKEINALIEQIVEIHVHDRTFHL